MRSLADGDDDSDDDLPSFEELFQTATHTDILTRASKTKRTLQLEQPAIIGAGMQVLQTRSGLGERQGDSPGRRAIGPFFMWRSGPLIICRSRNDSRW